MRELTNDPFYGILREYDRCVLDYCLIEDDTPYQGYRSHIDAVLFAMLKVIERYIEEQLKAEIRYRAAMPADRPFSGPFPWNLDIGKAKAVPIEAASLFFVLEITRIECNGNKHYDCDWKPYPDDWDGWIPYWYAFLEPPHGTGPVIRNGKKIRKKYGREDFEIVNDALFPEGTDQLEAYEWSTDWSNYFEAGHEWWGAVCWSVYDRKMNRFAVIMASTTD